MTRCSLTFVYAVIALFQLFAAAQDDTIHIWSAAIFARSGEHTTATDQLAPNQLTPLGAMQAHGNGAFLRERYIGDSPIVYINASTLVSDQVYILASDDSQYAPASAQALLQGLFPPYDTSSTEGNPEGVMADGRYLDYPFNGYQYPWIHTAGPSDSESLYVNGAAKCPAWDIFSDVYDEFAYGNPAENADAGMYATLGNLLGNEEVTAAEYGYWNAYNIFQQVDYLYTHNSTDKDLLESKTLKYGEYYKRVRYLADQYQWGLYGSPDLDPISTIAGRALASKIVNVLLNNIDSFGEQSKLNILVGDYAPLISLFSMANLESASSNFTGMPRWGSMAMFELYSPLSATLSPSPDHKSQYPYIGAMHVRFFFRNGTDGSPVQYPLFGTGKLNMTWNAFETAMTNAAVDTIPKWCQLCDAWLTSPFCLYYNTKAVDAVNGFDSPGSLLPGVGPSVSPVVAGVIGAGVTIGVLAMLVLLAVLLCGVRFSIAQRTPKDSVGGFKGNQKMASDADLTALKGPSGVVVEDQGTKERVGSWELKQKGATNDTSGNSWPGAGAQTGRPLSFVSSIRRSFDTHDPAHNPFQDPVKPDERV